jgi:hypothetical protein
MRTARPPALATWLMTKLLVAGPRESMVGDLMEQYERGRSSAWYWRQALGAIVAAFVAEIRRHKMIAVAVLLFSRYLDELYMRSKLWMLVWRLDQLWYAHLIHSRWSWLVINPWAYRLQPYWWTSSLAWCALLASVAWLMTRVYTQERGLVIALLLVGQLAARAPFLWTVGRDVFREPADPIAFYGLLWFSFYTFVATPLSIVLGGRRVLSSEF